MSSPKQDHSVVLFWWRNKAYKEGYTDEANRIMHNQVKNDVYYPWLNSFLNAGHWMKQRPQP